MAEYIYGKKVTDRIREFMMRDINRLKDQGKTPTLALLRVGERPDDLAYEKRILKNCEAVGICPKVVELEQNVGNDVFQETLDKLNRDGNVDAILVFRPLPLQIDEEAARKAIFPHKDIDCMSPDNLVRVFIGDRNCIKPCTPEAVIEILKGYDVPLEGKNVVIVNRSLVLGKPLAMLFLNENATVTVCHSRTKDLAEVTSQADIVVTGIGKAGFFGPTFFSEKSIVIDVGINFKEGKLCGDVDFEQVYPKVKAITPVPGGVGAVTTILLLNNVLKGIRLAEKVVEHG